jgi:hypothetical protein
MVNNQLSEAEISETKPSKKLIVLVIVAIIILVGLVILTLLLSGKVQDAQREIEKLLDKKCHALKTENLDMFMDTVDNSNLTYYEEIRQSMARSFQTVNVTECKYEIHSLSFNEEKTAASANISSQIYVRLINGTIKEQEKSGITYFKKIGNEWRAS